MKHLNALNPDEKLGAAMMVGVSSFAGVAGGILTYLAYTAIGSHGLLAYAGLLVTGSLTVLCAGAVIQYSGELSKKRIDG